MFQIRTTGLDVPLETIDGVTTPRALLDEAQKLANETRRIHYVGVIEKKNPAYREPKPLDPTDIYQVFAEILRPVHLLGGSASRYLMTGDFILSDDRDQVLKHAGCGRLVWVVPERKA